MTEFDVNYDEAQVGEYTLPDPLRLEDGTRIQDPVTWVTIQRPRLLSIFEQQVYGKAPTNTPQPVFETTQVDNTALDGLAIREAITVYLTGDKDGASMDMLFYYPRDHGGMFDLFLGLNFGGNHTARLGGEKTSRWPVANIIERGYGMATIHCEDIAVDSAEQFQQSIQPYLDLDKSSRSADDWGAIGVWAWGLCRAMDYFETREVVHKVVVMGHSRLGKAALWAGVLDERFALVISNNSGCMGAALSRRHFGETVAAINTQYPYWFRKAFHQYNQSVDTLPVDQHTLISLIAPRPVYVASADDDLWADPYGEFLGAKRATPVYNLFGKRGIDFDDPPALNHPYMDGSIGYHIRSGDHDVTVFDWQCYLDFADLHLSR